MISTPNTLGMLQLYCRSNRYEGEGEGEEKKILEINDQWYINILRGLPPFCKADVYECARCLWMTIKLFFFFSKRGGAKISDVYNARVPAVCECRTFDPKEPVRPLERYFHYYCPLYPSQKVNCFGHLSNRDQNNWTGYLCIRCCPGKRLIILSLYTDENITIIFEHQFSEDVSCRSIPAIVRGYNV